MAIQYVNDGCGTLAIGYNTPLCEKSLWLGQKIKPTTYDPKENRQGNQRSPSENIQA